MERSTTKTGSFHELKLPLNIEYSIRHLFNSEKKKKTYVKKVALRLRETTRPKEGSLFTIKRRKSSTSEL